MIKVDVVAARPDEYHHRLVQRADGDVANLAVVLPIVLDGQRRAGSARSPHRTRAA